MENPQNGTHIGKFLDQHKHYKRPQAPKPILLGLESEQSENQIIVWFFWKYMKFAHEISVHNGSYVFPNELVRFRI